MSPDNKKERALSGCFMFSGRTPHSVDLCRCRRNNSSSSRNRTLNLLARYPGPSLAVHLYATASESNLPTLTSRTNHPIPSLTCCCISNIHTPVVFTGQALGTTTNSIISLYNALCHTASNIIQSEHKSIILTTVMRI